MTPEELWQRIENNLNTAAEHLAHFDAKLEKQRIHHDAELEKQRIRHEKEVADIRDLLNAVAAVQIRSEEKWLRYREESAEHFRKHDVEIEELKELHRDTEAKLNALIETVDNIFRRRNKRRKKLPN